ncbi:MAG: DUF1698 domain-containing protein [Leptolyngbya sp. SIO3F4]|nr:DUF1698 domain-containing protein [Leptolyngbya sp. SIO3F4]
MFQAFKYRMHGLVRRWQRFYGKIFPKTRAALPFKGYEHNQLKTPFIDILSDSELQELNQLLRWSCFTVDSHGRRFGNQAWSGKRTEPQTIPDRRLDILHEYFDLTNKHVLEIGCFEGIHTIGLCQYASKVTAIDSRIENVVKTIVRCACFGHSPRVFKYDVEADNDTSMLLVDVVHHVGVLYHLKDPIVHLKSLGDYASLGLMLDTHYVQEQDANNQYVVDGITYRCREYGEGGHEEVFSGMYTFARWLCLSDIVKILKDTGFNRIDILEKRQERNGPRVLLIAKRA